MVCKGIASVFKSPCGVGKVMFSSGGNSKRGYNERDDEQGFWREGVVLFVWVKVWLDGRTSPSSCIRVLQCKSMWCDKVFRTWQNWPSKYISVFAKLVLGGLTEVKGKGDWAVI
ncbi:hypothetical protein Tco_1077921, partial [Tanacetum coccineum]